VRVLAPITPETIQIDATLERALGNVRITRYIVPYFLYDPWVLPFDEGYRTREHEAVREALPALIEAERPDVIVAGHETLSWYVPEIAGAYGVPWVLLLRGSPTWRIVNGTFPERDSREWLRAYSRADRIVAVARYFEEGLRHLGFENVSTIRNHVDLARFGPLPKDPGLLRELGISGKDVVIVQASLLGPRKDPLGLAASAARAMRECPELVYVVVGEGPLRAEVEEACRRSKAAERFRFTGWIPYERMPDFFNLADVVVQPSKGEGLSRVYLEAMACERALVASDIPAAREVIEHGENGLLFETGNIESLASATVLAARDPALRARLGRKARASIAAHSLDRVADEFVAVFHDVRRSWGAKMTPRRIP
jgi:glycosyltransferase involved in cell wall biosynthesis